MGLLFQEVLEVAIHGAAGGQRIVNIFHLRIRSGESVPVDGLPLSTIEISMRADWLITIRTELSNQWVWQRNVLRTIDNRIPRPPARPGARPRRYAFQNRYREVFEFAIPTETRGSRLGEALPTLSALGIRKVTNRAGRSYRGGMRVGPLLEEDTSFNLWTPTALARIQPIVNTMFTNPRVSGGVALEHVVFGAAAMWTSTASTIVPRDFTGLILSTPLKSTVTSQVSRKPTVVIPT